MIEFVDVVALKPLPGFRLWVQFSDGQQGIRDFADILAEGGEMVEPLKDEEFFRRVTLHRTVPGWPNGFEIDATNLHMELAEAGQLSATVAAE